MQTQDWTAYHTSETVRREFLPADHIERRPLLDKPSDPHPILNMLMDEALMRIMLTADGAVMALKERVTGSSSPQAPTSDLAAIIDDYGERFTTCKTHRRRLQIIKEAQSTAVRLRYSPDRSLIHGTTEWREAVAKDDRSVRVLANVYGVGKSTIARIKSEVKGPPAATVVQGGKRYKVKDRVAINKKRAEDKEREAIAAVEAIVVLA